ncbi:hypothetical protein SEPCBS119000_004797 [Sporothrix epigloea]|uniref:RidA family protein n=1 Tax=Sporothrix epigloea TaxID=1892477 RepID=A0ABP0DW90_9PEZI
MPSPPPKQLISSGSAFEAQIGYSRAVVSGDWVFVSGCTGYDYATGQLATGIADQADQALRNVAAALAEVESGGQTGDVARPAKVAGRIAGRAARRNDDTGWAHGGGDAL